MKNSSYRPVFIMAPGVLAGAEKVVLTGLAALLELGLNPLMIIIRETRSPKTAEEFQKALPPSIESKIIDSTRALDFKLPSHLKMVLQSEKQPIILHSHGFKALIAGYLGRGRSPQIHTHHGNTAHTFKVRIYEKIAMMTMKRCHQVIAVSDQMHKELESILYPYKKIVTIDNMLSLSNTKKIREERKLKYDPSRNFIELIYIGRLSPEKGLLQFLEYLNDFPSKEKFRLTILGDGIERPMIEQFIKTHKMDYQITMHGFVSSTAEFLGTPDVLIMPSIREGLPMTLIETLASGIPIIANDVGAISNLVIHKKNGWITPNANKDSWNTALNAAILSYTDWKKNAESEAENVEKRFDPKEWARKTAEIYIQALID